MSWHEATHQESVDLRESGLPRSQSMGVQGVADGLDDIVVDNECSPVVFIVRHYRNFIIREVFMTNKTATELVQEAKRNIDNLTPDQVQAEIATGNVSVVDVRDAPELSSGIIPGAVHASRGMLEFYADPKSQYHKGELNPDSRVILYCASSGRSALAVHTLQDLGYKNVAHLDGGFKAWQAAGKPVSS